MFSPPALVTLSFPLCEAAPDRPFPPLLSPPPCCLSSPWSHHPFSSTFGSARWWPKGAWRGGQRPSVLIRGVWHQGRAACLLRSAPRHSVQQQPGVPPVPAQLAGGVEGAHYSLPAVKQSEGEGFYIQPQDPLVVRCSEGDQRGRIG